ncbi:segregation and condensation protein A [Aliidiomarina celeris]|uniref:segregation and condensation protein A n=1 Tax=Aliidiomarina celeris TaxID=2249428 RepID=UPI000DE99F96|nr:ScpA family protein [Aliidiomarina celeris]
MDNPEPTTVEAVEQGPSEQQSLPLGFVRGEPVLERPEDLYIPPEALEIMLEAFSGPMDLLLYLIRRQKMDILDLPILQITRQYMEYVELMRELKLELAADYLVMAAMLAEIKSRLLLPKAPSEDEEELDPRAELIRRLQAYEVVREGARQLDDQPQQYRDYFVASAATDARTWAEQAPPDVSLAELSLALSRVMQLVNVQAHHQIKREALSTRERMSRILEKLSQCARLDFVELFDLSEGKAGVVVSFLAILELNKEGLLVLTQAEAYSGIYISAKSEVSQPGEATLR